MNSSRRAFDGVYNFSSPTLPRVNKTTNLSDFPLSIPNSTINYFRCTREATDCYLYKSKTLSLQVAIRGEQAQSASCSSRLSSSSTVLTWYRLCLKRSEFTFILVQSTPTSVSYSKYIWSYTSDVRDCISPVHPEQRSILWGYGSGFCGHKIVSNILYSFISASIHIKSSYNLSCATILSFGMPGILVKQNWIRWNHHISESSQDHTPERKLYIRTISQCQRMPYNSSQSRSKVYMPCFKPAVWNLGAPTVQASRLNSQNLSHYHVSESKSKPSLPRKNVISDPSLLPK